VIEYKREEGALDSFQWYCDQCDSLLHEVTFDLEDIVAQLPPLFDAYWQNMSARTCDLCGSIQNPPS
jgi:3-hydroxyanthranilate 3,4-dioxygenase